MFETSKSFRKSSECFFCGKKVLLGSLYSNVFAFNENINFQVFFFITMIKKIKEQIKNSVCTMTIFYPCCGK